MKMKKIIASTLLTGTCGLMLVACGSKKENATLVDADGNKYKVEETDDAEEVAKVVDSVVRKATEEEEQTQTKYGVNIKGGLNVKFVNSNEDKYSINADINGNIRTDIPAPEKDDEGNFTQTNIDYFSALGLSAGLDFSLKSNFPGLDLDMSAGVDLFSDEDNIYAKFAKFDLDDIKSVLPEDKATYVGIASMLSNQKLSLSKEAILSMATEEDDEEAGQSGLDFSTLFPAIDAYYEGGIGAAFSFIPFGNTDDEYDALFEPVVTSDEESDEDDIELPDLTEVFSIFAQALDFIETFNVEISDVDGGNVTFKMPVIDDSYKYLKQYFRDEDEADYTHAEIAEKYDGNEEKEVKPAPVVAYLYAKVDVLKLRPLQIKFETVDTEESEKLFYSMLSFGASLLFGAKRSEVERVEPTLRALTSEIEVSGSSSTTSIPEYQQNLSLMFQALVTSEIESFDANVVIDFVYGKNVDTISSSAKKDYTDATPVIDLIETMTKKKEEDLR